MTDRGSGPAPARWPIPETLRTTRLLLRPWSAADADALAPVLAANTTRLAPWIPAHVATPLPPRELAERLTGFAADFAAGRAFRFALVALDDGRLLGEADLFPRAAGGRVPIAGADRVELGYWLDAAAEGRGFAAEATEALLEVAAGLPGVSHAEIRCDPLNHRSSAVPRRLGFELAIVEAGTQVWRRALSGQAGAGG